MKTKTNALSEHDYKKHLPLAILVTMLRRRTRSVTWRAFGSPDEAEDSVQSTLDAFKAFDEKWGKFTEHQSIEIFSPKLLRGDCVILPQSKRPEKVANYSLAHLNQLDSCCQRRGKVLAKA